MLDRLTIERMTAAAGEGPILLALSGGGDSAALLHLMAERLGAARLRTLTIDHALRAGSDWDARHALDMAGELGIKGRAIFPLQWPPGAKPGQEAARRARYGALCAHARRVGARVITVGHTADDQAETVLMRAAAGSRWRGLAGMAPLAPAPLWPEGRGLLLARPLLATRRAALRDMLRRRGGDWIEDPANANPAFERVRARAALRVLETEEGFDPMRLARLAGRLRFRVEALDRAAAALIARAVRFDGGRVVLYRGAWSGAAAVRRRALSALVAAAAGAAREPAADALARLEERIAQDAFDGTTLGGARVYLARGDVVLERDRGGVEGRADGAAGLAPTPLPPGVEVVWDGRVALRSLAPGVVVVARGPSPCFRIDGVDVPDHLVSQRWLLAERAAHALAALPAPAPDVS